MKYYQVPDEYPATGTIGAYAPILLSAVDELLIEGTEFEGDEPRRKLQTLKNWIAAELGKGANVGYEEIYNWGGYDLNMSENVYRAMTPATPLGLTEGQKLVVEQVVEIMQTTGAILQVAAVIDDNVTDFGGLTTDEGDIIRNRMTINIRAGLMFVVLEVWYGNGLDRIDQSDFFRAVVREYSMPVSGDVIAYWRGIPDNDFVVSRRRYSVVERYG